MVLMLYIRHGVIKLWHNMTIVITILLYMIVFTHQTHLERPVSSWFKQSSSFVKQWNRLKQWELGKTFPVLSRFIKCAHVFRAKFSLKTWQGMSQHAGDPAALFHLLRSKKTMHSCSKNEQSIGIDWYKVGATWWNDVSLVIEQTSEGLRFLFLVSFF